MNQGKLSRGTHQQFTLPLFDCLDSVEETVIAVRGQACSASAPISTCAGLPAAVPQRIAAAVTALVCADPRKEDLHLPRSIGSDDADDPKSPNYRFRDTGIVEGSRKELAASMVIHRAKKDGSRVYATLIDWLDLEKNPREAKALITKSNLFGLVDWEALREGGMEPGAGFLIDRVYAAISPEPTVDHPLARQDYTIGLQTLRDRLEAAKTADEVVAVVDGLRVEYDGAVLTDEEAAEYKAAQARDGSLYRESRELRANVDAAYKEEQHARFEYNKVEHEIQKRERRNWSVKPEQREQLASCKAILDARSAEWSKVLADNRPRLDEIDAERSRLYHRRDEIEAGARQRNKLENAFHRSLSLMGERLVNVLRYRKSRESTFAAHITAVKIDKIKDWSWMEKDVARAPRVTTESVVFQMRVADTYDRVGGRTVTPESTAALKAAFNLRDVQSGNWVLRDVSAAKFHTENAAAAFADLADLLGIPDTAISFDARLALAFGARGNGAAGWRTGAAAAHYESIHRVINLTKNRGGGSLGHEWFHGFDDLLTEMVTGQPGSTRNYVTLNPDLLPAGEMRDAVKALRNAMLNGTHQVTDVLRYTADDVAYAARLLHVTKTGQMAVMIRQAGNVHDAVKGVDARLGSKDGSKLRGLAKRNYEDWRRAAIAYYGGNPEGGEIAVRSGPTMSSFALEARRLDAGGSKEYYRATHEMAARAFQSWIEDRLAEQGRKNDYLAVYSSNEFHVCPLTGMKWKPFPEGEERQRINAAFDRLFAAVRSTLIGQ